VQDVQFLFDANGINVRNGFNSSTDGGSEDKTAMFIIHTKGG
jgi:hypothetical protein